MENELLASLQKLTQQQTFAIGNDLVFIPGFNSSLNELFKKKVYTSGEINYCDQFTDPLIHYASTWAAKEAVYKAVKQIQADTLGWNKIEISRNKASGKPGVLLPDNFKALQISLTISHDGDYAWAIAIINGASSA